MSVLRTDFYVGLFLIGTVAVVLAALIATSGWGVDRYDIYVRTDDATDIAVDTRIFMQGLEVGRVASIAPRPAGAAGRLEFVLRLSLLDRFPDGTPLRLTQGTDAEVTTKLLGGSTVQLSVHSDSAGGTLAPGDTIMMHRAPAAMEAFGALARDLKGTIESVLVASTGTLDAVTHLADSLTVATGTTRRFLAAIQPGTEKIVGGVAANLDRLRLVLDSANVRTGITFQQLNATIAQSRQLMVSADSLTRLLVAMGGENRPEIRAIIANMRQLSQQVGFVLEQVGRRPMRLITGVSIPDSLSVQRRDTGRAGRSASPDSAAAARSGPRDTAQTRGSGSAAPRDTTPPFFPGAP